MFSRRKSGWKPPGKREVEKIVESVMEKWLKENRVSTWQPCDEKKIIQCVSAYMKTHRRGSAPKRKVYRKK